MPFLAPQNNRSTGCKREGDRPLGYNYHPINCRDTALLCPDQEFLDGTRYVIYPWNQSKILASQILKLPNRSVGSIQNLKSKI